jgi:hypothetical protein
MLTAAGVRKACATQRAVALFPKPSCWPELELCARPQGDSGFMLVRDGQVVFKSSVLQHFFDCPLQFGACPDFSESTDSAEDAAVFELAVQPGDILVAGSDGLWDNCYDTELMGLLPANADAVEQVRLQIFCICPLQVRPHGAAAGRSRGLEAGACACTIYLHC